MNERLNTTLTPCSLTTPGDISPSWSSILRSADSSIGLSRFAGPGGWNDPDMLEVSRSPCVWVGGGYPGVQQRMD